MKFLYTIFLIIYTALSSTATAQPDKKPIVQFNTARDSTYFNAYNSLKQLYIEKLDTQVYRDLNDHVYKYKNKWRSVYTGTEKELANDEGALKWLEKNWQITQFESYEQAVKEWENIWALSKIEQKQNKEFTDAMIAFLMEYGPQPFIDLEMEMWRLYPDKK